MVHRGTREREGSCSSSQGTHRLLSLGTEVALVTLVGSHRRGIHGPGCECEEVQVESRSQGLARDTRAGDAESLALK